MQIHTMLRNRRAHSTLRLALRKRSWHPVGPTLHLEETWSHFFDSASQGIVDFAVIDPWSDEARPPPHGRIDRLLTDLGPGRVILYVTPATFQPQTLASFQGAEGLSVLVSGIDDQPKLVRRALGKAAGHAFLARVTQELEPLLEQSRKEFLSRVLASSIECACLDELAAKIGLSTRELWSATKDLNTPSPRRILLWGRLCRAQGLRGLATDSLASVAYQIGYGDPASLCRLYRNLLGHPAGEIPWGLAHELVADGFLREMA